jgi:hypothetical protein
MMQQKDAIEQLIAEVLDGTELRLTMDSYTLEENLESGTVQIHCAVHNKRTGERQVIEQRGVGIVDAFFHGLVQLYSGPYPSLQTIRFADFAIRAKLETGHGSARSDSTAEVILRVANSEGREVVFTDSSPSITRSSIAVVLQSVEFFINSERAFIAVYRALQHARKANRPDSMQLYTQKLATLVEATSYSEVIEQIRAAELRKG